MLRVHDEFYMQVQFFLLSLHVTKHRITPPTQGHVYILRSMWLQQIEIPHIVLFLVPLT
jgi:hypothetical protein